MLTGRFCRWSFQISLFKKMSCLGGINFTILAFFSALVQSSLSLTPPATVSPHFKLLQPLFCVWSHNLLPQTIISSDYLANGIVSHVQRDKDLLCSASLYFPGPSPWKALNTYLLISLLSPEVFTFLYFTYFMDFQLAIGCGEWLRNNFKEKGYSFEQVRQHVLQLKCWKKAGRELHSALLKIRRLDRTGGELEVEGGGGLVISKGTANEFSREVYGIYSISRSTLPLSAKNPGESSITLGSAFWF